MAKQSMIQRERKRERLITKYSVKRDSLKADLKNFSSFLSNFEQNITETYFYCGGI